MQSDGLLQVLFFKGIEGVEIVGTEAIEYGRFTVKSDVYSFGITLWELFSYGKVPMPQFSNSQVVEEVLKGYRMTPPEGCPTQIATLMTQCWDADPENRPSFKAILEAIQAVETNPDSSGYIRSQM